MTIDKPTYLRYPTLPNFMHFGSQTVKVVTDWVGQINGRDSPNEYLLGSFKVENSE